MSTQAEAQIRDVLEELRTDLTTGLTEQEAAERLAKYGRNEIRETSRQSPVLMFMGQFKGVMSMLLIVAGIVSALAGDIKDTIVIAAVVILNAVMGFVQEFRAENAIAALKKLAVPGTRVIRDGRLQEISSNLLVPGDLVRVQAGDSIPSDGRLVEAINLSVEEAALTGESAPVEKDALHVHDADSSLGDRKSELFMGTTVAQGRGTFVVTNTGMGTQLGAIAEMIQSQPTKQTPLQRRLGQLGLYLAIGAVAVCAIVFLAGVLQGRDLNLMLLAAISLAVAAVPESLPAVITISLALGAQRMVKRNALMRKLPAVETLGCVTAICSDKTGTLTQNVMQVEGLYAGCNLLRRVEKGFSIAGSLDDADLLTVEHSDIKGFMKAVSLCNDAEIQCSDDGCVGTIGDPTETSLLIAARHAGMDVNKTKSALPRVGEVPFDSARKRMTTIHKDATGLLSSFTKGALDVVLPRCSHELRDGNVQPLTAERVTEILALGEQFAVRGSRVMSAASRSLEGAPVSFEADVIEKDLVFLGLAGISDPPRPEAAAAVQQCRDAGIHVAMITGDHKLTAAAIGSDLGVIADIDDDVCTGPSLDKMDEGDLASRVTNCRAFARVSPEHKVRIVQALQANGHIVAMTGDGVNDAPSLKQADVGVAMGITGTDVSREASDIILTDDNFATIVSAVEEGRTIYDNIRKFVRYMLATNLGEVLTMFIGMLAHLPLPLMPIQILWINLVTDGLPALALGVEPAEGDVMKRPPRDPNESLFSRGLWQHILWVGCLMATATLIMFSIKCKSDGEVYARTMAFFTLAAFQLFHVMAIRRERQSAFRTKLNTNKFLAGAVIGTFVAQIILTYVEPIGQIFKVVPISFADLMLCIGLSSTVFIAVELEKAFYRMKAKAHA